MNIEKFNKLALDLSSENTTKKIIPTFQSVIKNLQNIINQPQQPQHQTTLTENLNNLYAALDNSLVNELSPAWYQLLIDLKIDDMFGNNLIERIKKIIATNNITPASAKIDLDILFSKLNKIISSFTQIAAGLQYFNVGLDELAKGECEIGILIPRSSIENNLENLKDEIVELTFILNNFSELFSGEKQRYELKTLSTTDPLITVGTLIGIAAGFAKAVGYIIDNYKKLLEIKKLKNELENQGLPADSLQGIKKYCNEYMEKKIKELMIEFEKDCNLITEENRKQEVLNGVSISLNKIANRVDRGYNFEVRVNEPPYHEEDEKSENDEEIKKIAAQYFEIQSSSKMMQFLKTEIDPILKLPELL
ncbi:MAG: hypothetical protein D3923_14850 [Candidatus Electrothrix sp. AR3]|nr:hypothetical protein [Candidatus Electrothrix sp. AR3]